MSNKIDPVIYYMYFLFLDKYEVGGITRLRKDHIYLPMCIRAGVCVGSIDDAEKARRFVERYKNA